MVIARWESRGGRHYVEVEERGIDYHYSSDGARGYFRAENHAAAIKWFEENRLECMFPDTQKVIKRII